MLKIYCDKCEKEITSEEMGKLIYSEWTSVLTQKEPSSQLVRKEKDLCSNCMIEALKMFKK